MKAVTRLSSYMHLPDAEGEVAAGDESIIALVEPLDTERLVGSRGGATDGTTLVELPDQHVVVVLHRPSSGHRHRMSGRGLFQASGHHVWMQ